MEISEVAGVGLHDALPKYSLMETFWGMATTSTGDGTRRGMILEWIGCGKRECDRKKIRGWESEGGERTPGGSRLPGEICKWSGF